jgi:hypothetical protein
LKTSSTPTSEEEPTAYLTVPNDCNRLAVYAQAGDTTPALLLDRYGNLDIKYNIKVIAKDDSYPTAQLLNFSNDNVALNFDSWWDDGWKSSDSGSNFRIYKIGDKLRFSYANGVAQGGTISDWASEDNNCALLIDTKGNVAAGAISPTSILQVDQPTTGCGRVTTNGTTALTGTNTQFLNTFKSGDTISVSGETVRTIASISSDTSLTVTAAFSTSQNNLTYTLTGGTRLAVKGNGDIGVGTASPGEKLDVNGNIKFSDQGVKISAGTTLPTSGSGVPGNYGDLYVYVYGVSSNLYIKTDSSATGWTGCRN